MWIFKILEKKCEFSIFELHPRYFLTKLKKSLPPALKYFSDVLRCYNCHQSIPLNVRNIKHNYNMCWKCRDRDLEAKNWAKQFFEKAFFLKTSKTVPNILTSKKSFVKKVFGSVFGLYITIYAFSAHVVIMCYVPYIKGNRLVTIRAS